MSKFEEAFQRIVTELVGITRNEEQALEIFLSRLYNQPHGQRITFFFPDNTLDALNTVGTVPQVGQKIYIHTLLRRGCTDDSHLRRNYDDCRDPWVVERVDFSLTVPENSMDALKKQLYGIRPESYIAEVQLRKNDE